jgi:hypothetical protein
MRSPAVLALLLLLSTCVQAWCIARAAVPAQDAVRYVAMAQSIGQCGLVETWREHSEHPLYPALVYALHTAAQAVLPQPLSWCTAAQTTAALMLVLAVVPLHLLLRRLVEPSAAVAGSLFFCLLPEVARLGADALSDSTQLLLVCLALWTLARYWQTQPMAAGVQHQPAGHRAVWLVFCGSALGLAMLTRPESIVAAAMVVAALVMYQLARSTRERWFGWMCSMTALTTGMLIAAPYLVVSTSGEMDDMPARLLGRDTPTPSALELTDVPGPAVATSWRFSDGQAMAFGSKDSSVSSRFHGFRSALGEFVGELLSAFQYWVGALALVGVSKFVQWPQRRFDHFASALFLGHSLAAIYLASQLGYLSSRHLLTLVVLGLAPAGLGACLIGRWLAKAHWLRRWFISVAPRMGGYMTAVVVAAAVMACLPETLAELHRSRSGHRQAGDWLAAAGSPGLVLDTRGWTGLYSGRETVRYDMAKAAYRRPDLAYVVVEQRELELDSQRGRTLRYLLASAAEPVASFAASRGKPADTVRIYRWRAERFTERLRTGQNST